MDGKQETRTSMLRDGSNLLQLNRAIAWTGFFLGAASGMVIGLWAFDGPVNPPTGMIDYGDTSRRLLRLGHIAFFGIGYLNLLLASELSARPIDYKSKLFAAHLMNVANIFLPVTLMAAAALPVLKYLLPIPASAASIALAIVAWAAIRRAFLAPLSRNEAIPQISE